MTQYVAVVMFALAVDFSETTELCRQLYPLDIRLCDMQGQWYWTMNTDEFTRKDCSGFFGRMHSPTHGSITSTGRPGDNPTLQAQVMNRQVHLYPIDVDCKELFSYKAALIEPNTICFYTCGEKDCKDSAQCFTRNKCVPEAERTRIFNGLHYFGLTFAEENLKIIDRDHC